MLSKTWFIWQMLSFQILVSYASHYDYHASEPPKLCPEERGYILINKHHCVKFNFDIRLNFTAAGFYCKNSVSEFASSEDRVSGRLAQIDVPQLLHAYKSEVRIHGGDGVLLGASLNKYEEWSWLDTRALHLPWAYGFNPDSEEDGGDCVALVPDTSERTGLKTVKCFMEYNFACQIVKEKNLPFCNDLIASKVEASEEPTKGGLTGGDIVIIGYDPNGVEGHAKDDNPGNEAGGIKDETKSQEEGTEGPDGESGIAGNKTKDDGDESGTGNEKESETGSEEGSGTEPGTEEGSGKETGTEEESGKGTEGKSGTETGGENGTETWGENGTETGGENGTETGGENGTETGVENGKEAEGESGAETGGKNVTKTGDENGTETGGENGTETGVENGTETGVENGTETDEDSEKGTEGGTGKGTGEGSGTGTVGTNETITEAEETNKGGQKGIEDDTGIENKNTTESEVNNNSDGEGDQGTVDNELINDDTGIKSTNDTNATTTVVWDKLDYDDDTFGNFSEGDSKRASVKRKKNVIPLSTIVAVSVSILSLIVGAVAFKKYKSRDLSKQIKTFSADEDFADLERMEEEYKQQNEIAD